MRIQGVKGSSKMVKHHKNSIVTKDKDIENLNL